MVNELLPYLETFKVKQVPRSKNYTENRLVKLGSFATNIDSRKITLLTYEKKDSETCGLDIFYVNQDESSWKDEINL